MPWTKEQQAAYAREWAKSERGRQVRADASRAYHANKRAVQYGVPGRIGSADVRAVIGGASCTYCGTASDVGIDHIVGLHAGGPNDRENLQPCCNPCNASKMRGEQPRQWSWSVKACSECGRDDRRHHAHGLCCACYSRRQYRRRAAA